MGYLLSVCLALFGYFLYRQRHPHLPRPVQSWRLVYGDSRFALYHRTG